MNKILYKINGTLNDLNILIRKKLIDYFNLGTLPNFLILGTQKGGTTSLFKYIDKYAKNFRKPFRKETRFFSENYFKGFNHYKAFFPFKLDGNEITGEATPTYLFYHKCPQRVYKHLPNLKFIILLRNPVERAFSHYNFIKYTNRTHAHEPLSFKEALKAEEYRINITQDSKFFYEYKHYSYTKRGLYY